MGNTNETLRKPRIVSIFSGCGGLDYGFHMEGYETIWANDFAEWACKSFAANFGDVIHYKDITKIDPYTDTTIPECDIVLGGFPCQDFSIIWKQPGLNGTRGGLFRHFAEFVDAKKPKAFVAENVKGLITANNGRAIDTIIKDFESIAPGYVVKPHLYNFAEYGVPQFRERVLFVGVRIDTGFDFVHPKPSHGPNGTLPYVTAGEALEGVEKVPTNNEHINIKEKTRKVLELIPEGGNFTDIPKDNPLYVKGMISHVYRRIKRDEPAKTIIAAGGGGTWGYHYDENTQYEKGINIIVGGNSLGRGVTFPQLQTIYYCRVAKSPQADTMWQHARMFGYDRDPCLLRVFMPPKLFKLFSDINRTNNSIIKQIENSSNGCDIKIFYPTGLKPTRKNVLDKKAVGIYSGGVNYFPFYPVNKDVASIDMLLQSFGDDLYTVSLKLIKKIMEQLDSETADDWNAKAFIGFVNTLLATDPAAQGKLIVRRNRDIGKGTGTLLSPTDRNLGDAYPDDLVLTMYKITGNKAKGWDGTQLWIPNIKLPGDCAYYTGETI